MRLDHTLLLDEQGRTATVRELTVADVRQLLSEHCPFNKSPIMELLTDNQYLAKAFLSGIVIPPDGESLDKLPFTELVMIDKLFMEINQSVFLFAAAKGVAASPAKD
ncbi:MAG: hypothetical protein ACU836_16405 [Gammaproteobacteria bacterium]